MIRIFQGYIKKNGVKSKKRDKKRKKRRRRAGYNERGDKEGRKIRK